MHKSSFMYMYKSVLFFPQSYIAGDHNLFSHSRMRNWLLEVFHCYKQSYMGQSCAERMGGHISRRGIAALETHDSNLIGIAEAAF